MSVQELVDVMALGLDFTLRDVHNDLQKKGLPWTAAKGFKNAAPLTPYMALPEEEELEATDFTVRKNGIEVQRGNVKNMIFSLQKSLSSLPPATGWAKTILSSLEPPPG